METVGENLLAIGAAVAVGVLENEEFVVGLVVTRFVVRVGRNDGDPEPALVVPGHLHRIAQFGEFAFGGEEIDLKPGGQIKGLEGLFDVKKLDGTIKIGFNVGETAGGAVVDADVFDFALSDAMNRGVAQLGHLTIFFDFLGVVLVAERFVTAAVYVDAIQDGVVVSPEPILLFHGAVNRVVFGERFWAVELPPVNGVRQRFTEPFVGIRGEGETVDGLCAGCRLKVLLTLGKHIDEVDVVQASDASHGLGIAREILIFLLSVGEVLLRGEIFKRSGRDEVKIRSVTTVVGLREGVLHKGVEFGLEAGESRLAVEGFVIAEEREKLVGLETVQPFIG